MIILNKDRQTVQFGEKEQYLTRNLYRLLELLILNAGKIVTRAEIEGTIWERNIRKSNVLEVNIYNLRRCVKKVDPTVKIKSIANVGYMLEIEQTNENQNTGNE